MVCAPNQAVRLGAEAVSEQCKAIDEWQQKIGKKKRHDGGTSTSALEARIEALCASDVEACYRKSAGV